jgi:hypothetical protein
MKTIYLDHNIVHYFVKGFPKQLDAAVEHTSLRQAQASYPDVRFVVSDWNVIEAARECVGAQAPLDLADKHVTFFEQLHPLFIAGHDILERIEMSALALTRWHRGRPETLN